MAKRFTDTNKWDKASFADLSLKMKLVWIYLCDKSDHAGLWDININLMSFQIGEKITLKEIMETFGDKIQQKGKMLHIPSFVDFQYGKLNPANKAHLSVLNRLEKFAESSRIDELCLNNSDNKGLDRSINRPLQGAKDKDKDKEKDKEKESITKLDMSNTEAVEPLPKKTTALDFRTQIENIYALYPRKEGKKRGMEILLKQIKNQADLDNLKKSVINYSNRVKNDENTFIKHFSTFAGVWTDYLDDTPETQPNKEIKGVGYDGRALIAMLDKNREKYKRKKQWEDFFYEKTGKPLYPDYIPYDIRMQAIDQEEAENDRQQQL